MKKRLSDITNLHSQHKSPFKILLPAVDDSSTKAYIDQLLKENAVLTKLIEEKDKIIEANGNEIQKLRVNIRTTQLQNWHLAQSNSQMLAELNMAKDRLKTLQHELLSINALFKAMNIEKKENANMHLQKNSIQEGETKSVDRTLKQQEENSDIKTKVSKPKRGFTARSQSMGPTTSRQTADKETVEAKRRCLRRQSVRLKPSEKHNENFEIEVSNKHVDPTTDSLQSKSTDVEKYLSEPSERTGSQRLSIGRPRRSVTEKVVSYKDPPVNIKMRRPE